jgi:hypothetical protein
LEDRAKEKRNKHNQEFNFDCLSLNYEQLRLLYSIEKQMVQYDISHSREATLKSEWEDRWENQIGTQLRTVNSEEQDFLMEEDEIYQYIQKNTAGDERIWLYLVVLEAMLFEPYYSIDNEKANKYRKLKYNSDYLMEQFVTKQAVVGLQDIKKLRQTYKKYCRIISGSTRSIVAGAIGTTVLVFVTGGVALTMAPEIAVVLVGGGTELSGVALTNYSLAAIGGGSLAAGGLGMAGGTAIIAGGGACLGMLGGTSASAASTMELLTKDRYIFSECSKLLTYSDEVLMRKFNSREKISDIQISLSNQITNLSDYVSKVDKAKIKAVKKSLKYMKRCDEELQKLKKRNGKEDLQRDD